MEDGGAEGGNWDGLPPEVLGMILEHLPVPDLLSCSVVTKNWKNAARDILKRTRECYAHIKSIPRDLQDLNEMIASTDIMEMINGLHIRNETRPKEKLGPGSSFGHQQTRCLDVEGILQSEEVGRKLEEAKQKILGVLCGRWRYLDFGMGFGWEYLVSLDKGLLLREVILSTSGSLQKLVIAYWRDWKFISGCGKSFVKLEVIKAQKEQDLGYLYGSYLSKFAPNLKKITGAAMSLPDDLFTLERIKSVRVFPDSLEPQVEEKDVFRAVSGLQRLDLHSYRGNEGHNVAEWNALVFPFMLRSLNTLKELRLQTQELYVLSTASNGLKFPNLRRLSLAKHPNVSWMNEISSLKSLNLPRLCPNLEQVKLTEERCFLQVEQEVIPVDILAGLDQSDVPIAIDLEYQYGQYEHEHMTLLSSIYPKISKLRILNAMCGSDCDASKIFLSSYWDLQSLEYLEISVLDPPCDIQSHIEAFLSGINIEEAQLPSLRSRRKKNLLNLCIVPIRPSLLNAKNLKELKITVGRNSNLSVDRLEKMGRSWVTQVIENLPERHVRNLRVTFDADHFCDGLVQMRSLTCLRANKITA